MRVKDCSVKGCGRPHEAKGLCHKHYKRLPYIREKSSTYQKQHPLSTAVRHEYYKTYYRSLRGRFNSLERAARDLGIPSDITEEQLAELLKQPCFYCGAELNPTGSGLDRKDSDVGYLLANVVPCCKICNRIKNRYLTHEEMMVAMQAVMSFRNKRGSCG